MRKCNFTFKHYKEILKAIKKEGFIFNFFNQPSLNYKQKTIYLRHDIDVSLENALKLARIEKNLGVSSAYFIRIHSIFYNPFHHNSLKTLKEILNCGHRIGLHYDGEILKNFSSREIEKNIKKEYEFLNNFINLSKIVSFHRPTPNLFGLDLKEFVSTYSNYFFKKIEYISDSNRELKRGCILDFIKIHSLDNIQILIHPFWWNEKSLNPKELYKKLLNIKKLQIERETRENMKCYNLKHKL